MQVKRPHFLKTVFVILFCNDKKINEETIVAYQNFQFITTQIQLFQFYQEGE